MKTSLLLCSVCFFIGVASAQGPKFAWAKQYEGTSNNWGSGYGISVDRDDNVIHGGFFGDVVDMDPGAAQLKFTGKGSMDAFVTKLDKDGNFIWAKQIGGPGFDGILSVATDDSGNVYCAGVFADTVDVNPDAGRLLFTSNGDMDIFILKLSSNGKFIWAKHVGGFYYETVNGICVDSYGDVVLTGSFEDEVDFDPGSGTSKLITNGVEDIFVLKLNKNGNLVWANHFKDSRSSYYSVGWALTSDRVGDVYITGAFEDTTDFDPGSGTHKLVPNGAGDIFVCKLNRSGKLVWVKQMGGSSYDIGRGIAVDADKNVFITGGFRYTSDFDPGSASYLLTADVADDVFVSRLDSNGSFVWAVGFGAWATQQGIGIVLDTWSNVYINGYVYGTVDFDPDSSKTYTVPALGYYDAFVMKLDAFGKFNWARQIGGKTVSTMGNHIALGSDNAIYSNGAFNGKVDFDPDNGNYHLNTAGGYDVYCHKMYQCSPTDTAFDAFSCDTLVINGQIYTKSGTYKQRLTNSTGCDSFLSIQVHIQNTFDTFQKTVCKEYNWNGIMYNQSGIYTQKFTNKAGCDSLLTMQLTVRNTYDTLTASDCKKYVLNGISYNSSGTYQQTLTNAAGCDSLLTIHLTITNQSTRDTVYADACDTLWMHGKSYTSSGIYVQALSNYLGCDSFVTIYATVHHSSSETIGEMGCDSIWVNKILYAQSGTYYQYFSTVHGCDSTLVIHATVHSSKSRTISDTACFRYMWNGKWYTQSGTYQEPFHTTKGCDSVVTLQLKIDTVNVAVSQTANVLSANATGATYQWVHCSNYQPISGATLQTFAATANGSYAVIVIQNSCSDTSACFTVSGLSAMAITSDGIAVYPNPVYSQLFVQLNQAISDGSIQLFTTTGQIVYSRSHVSGNHFQMDLHAVAEGTYIMVVCSAGQTYRTLVQVNR